jgi:Arc/MetJ-type ribon-helix-helix transcriptional regulator
MTDYGKKRKMKHINIFVPEDLWDEVKSKVAYGVMSEFVRDCIREKLERMEEEANQRRYPTLHGDEGDEN